MFKLPQQDPANDDRGLDNLERAQVSPKFFRKEIFLLLIAVLIPIFVLIVWRDSESFQASGSLVVFFAVLTEFLLLNKQNAKHIGNSARAARGDAPRLFSKASIYISYFSLVIAAIGTIIWGYGNKFF